MTTTSFISVFSGLCSIAALLLFFITVPKQKRTISLLVTSILIGLPIILFLVKETVLLFSISLGAYTTSIVLFAFLYGKTKAKHDGLLPDLILASNHRTSGKDWIIEKVMADRSNLVNIDCLGVKVDALYKVLKGATGESKLPFEKKVNMRVLLLEPDSFGVDSRAKLEGIDKIKRDVPLLNDVYDKLIKQYKKHPNHHLKVRTFEFTPGFYILRVNNNILLGTYLAESGYENLCLHLKNNDGHTFNQFERFFERVWNHYSKPLVSN